MIHCVSVCVRACACQPQLLTLFVYVYCQEKERVCQLQSKVSGLESLLKRHREQEEKKDQDVQNCQGRIESLQTELDKKVAYVYVILLIMGSLLSDVPHM